MPFLQPSWELQSTYINLSTVFFYSSQVGCLVVAILLHYFFTAVFMWMLCEGILIYFLPVKVFNTGIGKKKWFYLAIGWGEYWAPTNYASIKHNARMIDRVMM